MRKIEKFFEKIENIFSSKYGNIYAYGIVLILCFFIMLGQNLRTEPHDDIVHSNAVKQFGNAFNFMISQYENVNGRYFTSLVMAFVMDKNIWLWRVLNSIVLFGLIYYIYKLFSSIYNKKDKVFRIAFFGIFATFALLSSGIWTQSITWVTGSFNYLWTTTALVILLYYILNYIFNNISLKIYEFILIIPLSLYAANSEQSALILLTIYFFALIYAYFKYKTLDIYFIALFILCIISAYFLFTSPSMLVRYEASMSARYPQLAELSFLQKSLLGYPYTVLYGLLLNNYTLTILLSFLLFVIIKKQFNNKIYNILILLPALYALIYYFGRIKMNYLDSIIFYNLRAYSLKVLHNKPDEPFISLILGSFLLFIIIFFIFKIKWDKIENKILCLLFFSASLLSAFIISFSPTIFASGERIWFIPYSMYILSLLLVFIEALKYIDISSNKFKIIFSIYVIVGVIDVFSKVYR